VSDSPIQYQLDGSIAILRFDDGKANTFSPDSLAALNAALDRAEKDEARCILWSGRPGRFSAGFDLSFMREPGRALLELVASGARMALRVHDSAIPVVLAVTGHALAMGAITLMAADRRIGVEGNFKIGLNEVAIGMTLPDFGVEFARARLALPHQSRSVVNAEIYDPVGAVEAGYLDRVVAAEDLEAVALAEAQAMAALDPTAFAATKKALRGEASERILAAIERIGV